MRTLEQISGQSLSARIQALAAAVVEGPIDRAESAAEEATNLLKSLAANTLREDEREMLKFTSAAFKGAARQTAKDLIGFG